MRTDAVRITAKLKPRNECIHKLCDLLANERADYRYVIPALEALDPALEVSERVLENAARNHSCVRGQLQATMSLLSRKRMDTKQAIQKCVALLERDLGHADLDTVHWELHRFKEHRETFRGVVERFRGRDYHDPVIRSILDE